MKRLTFFLLPIIFAFHANAQSISITRVEVDEGDNRLKIYLNGLDENNRPNLQSNRTLYTILETKGGSKDTVRIESVEKPNQNSGGNGFQTRDLSFLYLLDTSGSMKNKYSSTNDKFSKAVAAIRQTMQSNPGAKSYFSHFDRTVSPMQELNEGNFDEVVASLQPDGGTALYQALTENIKEFSKTAGTKVIILLSDGQDDRLEYNRNYAYSENTVTNALASVTDDLLIFSIGYGEQGTAYAADIPFLKSLPAKTTDPNDDYLFASSPGQIGEVMKNMSEGIQEHLELICYAPFPLYEGIERELKIVYSNANGNPIAEGNRLYRYGSPMVKSDITPLTSTNRTMVFVWGIGIVLFMLIVFIVGVPMYNRRSFNQKYVKRFGELDFGRRRPINPITDEPFEEYDQVVTRCEHIMTVDDWRAYGHKCLYYPRDCSEGVDQFSNTRFFNQQGINKMLNWIWFGSIGALLAVGLISVLQNLGLDALQQRREDVFESDADVFFRQIIAGVSMGTMISIMLSLVEELGQSRKVSWYRIAIRTLIGLVASVVIFSLGTFIGNIINMSYPTGLITWLLAGTAIGYILSINSSIEPISGLKGGALASLIGFHVNYFLTLFFFSEQPEYGVMVGFIVFGGILGGTIYKVVAELEDFQLETLAPSSFRGRINPISKWLKTGISIYMGTDDDCHVFVKWLDDAVEGRHAKLSYEDGRVFIHPIGETLVNDRAITSTRKLEHDDVIKLGYDSLTSFRYKEKRANPEGNASFADPLAKASSTAPSSIKIKSVRKVR